MDPTITDLSHQRTLFLFVGGCHKKKVKRKTKQKMISNKKIDRNKKISTKFKSRK